MQDAMAAPRAQAPIIPFPSPPKESKLEPRPQVTAWLGLMPSAGFWGSLKAAQDFVKPMVKDEEFPDKKGKHFSRTEDWIREGRGYLLKFGLIGSQAGAILLDGANGSILATQFLVVSAVDGTGLLCAIDWPVYGFAGGKGSPGHGNAAAFTGAWKYWIRGLLAIPQVDEGEEFEQRDGSIDAWDARKKNEASGRAATVQRVESDLRQIARDLETPRQPARQYPDPARVAEYVQEPAVSYSPDGQWWWDPNSGWQPVARKDQIYDEQHGQWQSHQGHPAEFAGQQRPTYQRPEYDHRAGQLPPQPQGPTSEAIQRDSQLLGAQFPPQQAQRPPVAQEPIVQYAQRALGSEPIPQTNQAPPQREVPKDGGPDHTFEELVGIGWKEVFARHLAAVGPNEAIPAGLRDQFLMAVNEYFDGNNDAAFAAWAGTGFTPSGEKGPKPTGAHLRRYALKLDWNKRAAPAAGR